MDIRDWRYSSRSYSYYRSRRRRSVGGPVVLWRDFLQRLARWNHWRLPNG